MTLCELEARDRVSRAVHDALLGVGCSRPWRHYLRIRAAVGAAWWTRTDLVAALHVSYPRATQLTGDISRLNMLEVRGAPGGGPTRQYRLKSVLESSTRMSASMAKPKGDQ